MSAEPAGSGARRLGLPSASALVVANMIGVGVFTTSGYALADLGRPEWVLAAWALGGVIALCGALSYGALARAIPESGGEYTFLARTVHPAAGFVAGWISLIVGFTGPIATAALGLASYLRPWLDDGSGGALLDERLVGSLAIVGAAWLHGLRRAEGVRVQNLAVALKLLAITTFIVWGATRLGPTSTGATPSAGATEFDGGAFAVSLVWIAFSYSGWNAVVYVGGEVRDPERNLSRSLVLATTVVAVLYLGLNAVFLFAAPVEQLAGRADIGAAAAEALGGAAWRDGLILLVVLALGTSVLSMIMAGPRVYARMAEDGLFPRVLAGDGGPPRAAVWLQAALAVAVVWIARLEQLLGAIGFILGLSTAATVVALLVERRRRGAARLPIPGYPVVPLAFLAATLGASGWMVLERPGEALVALGVCLAALPAYALLRRWRPAGPGPGDE